jgi:hypothetical protein
VEDLQSELIDRLSDTFVAFKSVTTLKIEEAEGVALAVARLDRGVPLYFYKLKRQDWTQSFRPLDGDHPVKEVRDAFTEHERHTILLDRQDEDNWGVDHPQGYYHLHRVKNDDCGDFELLLNGFPVEKDSVENLVEKYRLALEIDFNSSIYKSVEFSTL